MSRTHANLLLLLAAILWGTGNASQKLISQDLGPIMATGLRCLIAAFVIFPFAWRERPLTAPCPEKRLLMLATVANFAAAVTLYQVAFTYTSVTNAGFLVNICSVMTPIAAWWILRSPPAIIIWPCALLALCGVGAMSGAGIAINLGDACAVLSALAYALWMVLLGEYVRMHGHARTLTFMQFALTGLVVTAIGLSVETVTTQALVNALPHLVFVGIFSTGLGYMLQAIAQQHTSASETAIIVSAEAVFGAMAGYMVFGEQLTSLGYFGAAMILFAILLVETWPLMQRKWRSIRGYQIASHV